MVVVAGGGCWVLVGGGGCWWVYVGGPWRPREVADASSRAQIFARVGNLFLYSAARTPKAMLVWGIKSMTIRNV